MGLPQVVNLVKNVSRYQKGFLLEFIINNQLLFNVCYYSTSCIGVDYVKLILIPLEEADVLGFASFCCLLTLLYFSINS